MKEEKVKNFVNTVIFLSRIFSVLNDKFLRRKLYGKLSDFIEGYLERKDEHVAQSVNMKLNVATDSLLEFLDYIEYGKIITATPLLYARKSLLLFKLNLLRARINPKITKTKEEKRETVSVARLKPRKEIDLSENKEKILNYIKSSPDSRTKDIVYEFNSVLSERTVKRNLKELVSEGFVKKSSKDRAVFYR
ncbi:MAG: hypothetical protein COV30_00015 [Candidatus Yanofskybacteria bacterium CG10_big_fil_rev_8_21_14_0_10_37_15]|uniref:HTH deoR-type domain-containing protein n=1 Tax=Candidatus Yanofskybacteria bacterium CG10_big_fil_rev_8_21_14_0_10_37_15 TaxID=1975097 RepID=A0A2H0R725_9BACT|nr:MAG: hypothetical protein COV30_00015 [Candidatus Yanofskybacteria bacterium CG10_big_fil_rev_8_21_14_0_10_37_15]